LEQEPATTTELPLPMLLQTGTLSSMDPLAAGSRSYTVSQITFLIRDLLEQEFFNVTVEGEISNLRPSSTGHLYFSLKDEQAILSVVMFKNRLGGLAFQPADGLKVKATGNVSVYAKRGNYQLICESMVRSGEGEILAMLERRKQKLAALGLFDPQCKKPLPMFPARVAVVTSPTGAAIRDILRVLKRRNAGLDLVILPAPVQGEGAGEIIARQIRTANAFRMADVLIVARGGGSLEDLLPFSEESVVYAIAESQIPVISAVGHEIDFTLSDFAADVRAPTPSAAAELVSASRVELARSIGALQQGLCDALLSRLEKTRLRLEQFSLEDLERQLRYCLQPHLLGLDEARQGLSEAMGERLRDRRHRLELLSEALAAASPLAILSRGYAVVTHLRTGRTLLSAAPVKAEDLLDIRLHRGGLTAAVKEKRP
jgi:exodeoxyribonuclease VII large subunit